MEFSRAETELLDRLFADLVDSDVTFVVPRGYRDLPHSVPGSDVDVYVADDDFEETVRLAERLGFGSSDSSTGVRGLVEKVASNPGRAMALLSSDRAKALRFAFETLTDTETVQTEYEEWKGSNGNVALHLTNHVVYESPMKSGVRQMIRVDPAVEESLFRYRRFVDGIPVPSEPDELAHLLCRGVFSYEGEFPPYYERRCRELSETVLSSPEMEERFERLLSLLFFDADRVVRDHVERDSYDQLKSDLVSFADY
ncbi:hypothetical protein [Halorussus sp. MSC15.2]|uniref:hypothetical protein n=1 Tax=Halorussus sp. MSC15.2 TaxID=2283638 RepID=UPI0013D6A1EE|nr:hypothetical protein [Halorussus sp. MSC15.2]NEU56295.1 hypothetical protein [Halorussus sp. MSC15.2]